MPLDKNVTYADHEITLADGSKMLASALPQWAQIYWLEYGIRQSTSDSIAGMVKELSGPHKNADGKDVDALSDDEIKAEVHAAKVARQASVLDGSIGTRGTGEPRATKRETIEKTVTQDWLKKAAEKAQRALPKFGSDEYKALFSAFAAKNAAAIGKEVERRMGEPEVELSL